MKTSFSFLKKSVSIYLVIIFGLKEEFLSFVLFSLFFKTFLDLNKLLDYSLWTMNYINTNDLFLS